VFRMKFPNTQLPNSMRVVLVCPTCQSSLALPTGFATDFAGRRYPCPEGHYHRIPNLEEAVGRPA
jgi:hypothetical protein